MNLRPDKLSYLKDFHKHKDLLNFKHWLFSQCFNY